MFNNFNSNATLEVELSQPSWRGQPRNISWLGVVGRGSQDRKCEALGLCFKEIVRISSIFCDIFNDLKDMRLFLGLWWAAIVNGEELIRLKTFLI
jgi:hypothetical protein